MAAQISNLSTESACQNIQKKFAIFQEQKFAFLGVLLYNRAIYKRHIFMIL